jgi:hypothetical protein
MGCINLFVRADCMFRVGELRNLLINERMEY